MRTLTICIILAFTLADSSRAVSEWQFPKSDNQFAESPADSGHAANKINSPPTGGNASKVAAAVSILEQLREADRFRRSPNSENDPTRDEQDRSDKSDSNSWRDPHSTRLRPTVSTTESTITLKRGTYMQIGAVAVDEVGKFLASLGQNTSTDRSDQDGTSDEQPIVVNATVVNPDTWIGPGKPANKLAQLSGQGLLWLLQNFTLAPSEDVPAAAIRRSHEEGGRPELTTIGSEPKTTELPRAFLRPEFAAVPQRHSGTGSSR